MQKYQIDLKGVGFDNESAEISLWETVCGWRNYMRYYTLSFRIIKLTKHD